MNNSNILHNYKEWLEHHQMPAGKKKTLVAAIELFSQQGYNGTSLLLRSLKKLGLVRLPSLNILKLKVNYYQKLCSL